MTACQSAHQEAKQLYQEAKQLLLPIAHVSAMQDSRCTPRHALPCMPCARCCPMGPSIYIPADLRRRLVYCTWSHALCLRSPRPLQAGRTCSTPAAARAQMLVQGGYRDNGITSACAVVNTDQWKWFQPHITVAAGGAAPAPRTGHALIAVRESIFMFGGLTEKGLTNELWVLDLDSLAWSQARSSSDVAAKLTCGARCMAACGPVWAHPRVSEHNLQRTIAVAAYAAAVNLLADDQLMRNGRCEQIMAGSTCWKCFC
jgi:Kelch motif